METTFRAAIIGTGRIGSTYDDGFANRREPSFYQGDMRHYGLYTIGPVNHAGAYRTTPGFELVAAANRSADKLQAFGARWGVRALYTDFREMLREERPDIVSVCTRSPEKAEITIAAAEAGVKAIIVEKAMATSMAEADAMLEACERHGVFLAVNHPTRFSPMARQVKALIDQGVLGTLGALLAYRSSGMLHIGTHTFDTLRYWAGAATHIQAHVPNYVPEQDIPAVGTVWFANGAIGFFDHTHRETFQSYEVRGSEGFLTLSHLIGDGWLFRTAPTDAQGQPLNPARALIEPIGVEPHTTSATQRLLSELYQTLTADAPFCSTGRDGAAALELCLACYASHLAGGPIPLPLSDRTLRVPNR